MTYQKLSYSVLAIVIPTRSIRKVQLVEEMEIVQLMLEWVTYSNFQVLPCNKIRMQKPPHPDFIFYSTVTDFAKFLGLSTSVPLAIAV